MDFQHQITESVTVQVPRRPGDHTGGRAAEWANSFPSERQVEGRSGSSARGCKGGCEKRRLFKPKIFEVVQKGFLSFLAMFLYRKRTLIFGTFEK